MDFSSSALASAASTAAWTLVSVAGVIGVGVADAMGYLPAGPAVHGIGGSSRSATVVTMSSVTIALAALAWLAESRADELLSDLQRQKQVFQRRELVGPRIGQRQRGVNCLLKRVRE